VQLLAANAVPLERADRNAPVLGREAVAERARQFTTPVFCAR
jgi:hypothetical protein